MTTCTVSTPFSTYRWLNYEFKVYDANVDWETVPEVGGIYIFAFLRDSPLEWVPLYIGETKSFADRIPSHEKWPKLRELRVSHIHVHVLGVRNEAERKNIEKELRQTYTTRLNEEYY